MSGTGQRIIIEGKEKLCDSCRGFEVVCKLSLNDLRGVMNELGGL